MHHSACTKEFSYERRPDSLIRQDSVIAPATTNCTACVGADITAMWKWSFNNNNYLQCGRIDTAILTPNRNAFTFFGPSACSADTGLVITAYLDPIRLDKDIFNFTTDYVAFYYYDHVKPSYIFMVRPPLKFSLTIESYIHQTGIVKGRFSGSAFKDNNGIGNIESGRFALKLY